LWSHSAPQDHPRAGGEHSRRWVRAFGPSGSSPRRRGARLDGRGEPARRGIIPAQAGSTISDHDPPPAGQDHPRAGGEHLAQEEQVSASEGSSPRRRGARLRLHVLSDVRGIIPAQAGSTTPSSGRRCRGRDHPRAGGEHAPVEFLELGDCGSSPRRRGAPNTRTICINRRGIIPAQAGSTSGPMSPCPSRRDHPRAGGEHLDGGVAAEPLDGSSRAGGEHYFENALSTQAEGSSPRRRGAPWRDLVTGVTGRIIPAQAGST